MNGVRLHYLDWGGQGDPLVLLTGMGNSAHIYDDLAPQFTDRFHVVALTRRGHAQSDRPLTGYDSDTLIEDLRQFLDSLAFGRVAFAGHSIAGGEMTCFAVRYPDRVSRLIYFDAAYDRARLPELIDADPVGEPSPGPADVASFDTFRAWYRRTLGFWSDAWEADLRAAYRAPDGSLRPTMPRVVASLLLESMARTRPDYEQVRAPALAFYAVDTAPSGLPADADSTLRQAAWRYHRERWAPYQRAEIARFVGGVACHRLVAMPGAHHYLFMQREAEVVRAMRDFLLATHPCGRP